MFKLKRELIVGSVSNGDSITLNNVSYLFVKNKQNSKNECYLRINDNTNLISLEVGEKKFYLSENFYFDKIEIITSQNSTVEFEYYH